MMHKESIDPKIYLSVLFCCMKKKKKKKSLFDNKRKKDTVHGHTLI